MIAFLSNWAGVLDLLVGRVVGVPWSSATVIFTAREPIIAPARTDQTSFAAKDFRKRQVTIRLAPFTSKPASPRRAVEID